MWVFCFLLDSGHIEVTRSSEMNIAPNINNHLRSIDLFRSMIKSSCRPPPLDDWATLWDNCSRIGDEIEGLPGHERNRPKWSSQVIESKMVDMGTLKCGCWATVEYLYSFTTKEEVIYITRLEYVQACRVRFPRFQAAGRLWFSRLPEYWNM